MIQIRIAQIDKEFNDILNTVTAENPESLLTDPRIEAMMSEKRMLEQRLAEYSAAEQHRKNAMSRLDNIFTVLDGMKNHPLTFDNEIIRKILQCVIVESKDKIKVVFIADLKWKLRWSNDVSIAKTAYSSAEILQNAIEIYL